LSATRVALKRGSSAPHVLAASLALVTVLTPLYIDVPFRYLIRYDYLPLLLVPLGAWALASRPRSSAAALGALVALQLVLALGWDRSFLAARPRLASWVGPIPDDGWYGRDGQSYFAFFRAVGGRAPGACRYVFRLEEMRFGDWQFDVLAALWSELPRHLLIGDPAVIARWRFKPNLATREAAAPLVAEPCAWLSPDAAALFGR
jgi:hypothetical protein